jgi:hypothetical protein
MLNPKFDITTEHLQCLKRFVLKHMDGWKLALSEQWFAGTEAQGNPDGHLLRQLRNNAGLEWLHGFDGTGMMNVVRARRAIVTERRARAAVTDARITFEDNACEATRLNLHRVSERHQQAMQTTNEAIDSWEEASI